MKTSEMIRILCTERGISIAELARRIGQSPQNLGKKLKRGTVSHEEMQKIAEVFGLSYEQAFTKEYTEDNIEQFNESDTKEEQVSKYFSEEMGFSIIGVDEDDILKEGYSQLDKTSFARINALLKTIPHNVAELRAKRMSADAYKVIYDKGLGHLQRSAKNKDRFRANIVEFGTNNHITSQAELEKFQMKISSPALAVFDIAAIITNQYYLADIDKKITSLNNKIEYVQRFLEESKKSDLWANGIILQDISGTLYEITQDDQYRLATLVTVQGIRRDTLSNVRLYHELMSAYVEKHLDKKNKDFSVTKNAIRKFNDLFEAYCYSVYVYGYAYVIEIVLSQLTDEVFLDRAKKEIEGVIDSFKADYSKELKQFIDNVKSLNPGFFTEAFADYTPFSTDLDFSSTGLIIEFVRLAVSIGARIEFNKKKAHKEEVEAQFTKMRKRIDKGLKEIHSPVLAIERMNAIYNRPVELLIDEESAYIKLPDIFNSAVGVLQGAEKERGAGGQAFQDGRPDSGREAAAEYLCGEPNQV